ncbi:hypothetical protein TWF718_002265 [Orbilia javanica]|uniref:Uncharacterized protein n=1 Tax=Orbilia javanica TaxID=47235 RepID=A0AAN8MJU0_9PEZI
MVLGHNTKSTSLGDPPGAKGLTNFTKPKFDLSDLQNYLRQVHNGDETVAEPVQNNDAKTDPTTSEHGKEPNLSFEGDEKTRKFYMEQYLSVNRDEDRKQPSEYHFIITQPSMCIDTIPIPETIEQNINTFLVQLYKHCGIIPSPLRFLRYRLEQRIVDGVNIYDLMIGLKPEGGTMVVDHVESFVKCLFNKENKHQVASISDLGILGISPVLGTAFQRQWDMTLLGDIRNANDFFETLRISETFRGTREEPPDRNQAEAEDILTEMARIRERRIPDIENGRIETVRSLRKCCGAIQMAIDTTNSNAWAATDHTVYQFLNALNCCVVSAGEAVTCNTNILRAFLDEFRDHKIRGGYIDNSALILAGIAWYFSRLRALYRVSEGEGRLVNMELKTAKNVAITLLSVFQVSSWTFVYTSQTSEVGGRRVFSNSEARDMWRTLIPEGVSRTTPPSQDDAHMFTLGDVVNESKVRLEGHHAELQAAVSEFNQIRYNV